MKIPISLSKRPLLHNMAILVSGTGLAQLIALAFTPLITRLYGPELFGLQGIFLSVSGILAVISSLTYPIAIVLPRSDSEALSVARLSIILGFATSVITAGGMYAFGRQIFDLLSLEAMYDFRYLIPVFMFSSVATSVATQWLTREKAFASSAKMSVLQALVTNGTKTGVGFHSPVASSLMSINAFSGLITLALVSVSAGQRPILKKIKSVLPGARRSNSWEVAKRYSDFPLLRAPQVLLSTLSNSLPVLLLSISFGPAAAGYYALAYAVIAAPVGLIGGAISQVFYPRINEAINQGENAKLLIIKATFYLFMVSVPIIILLLACGPVLFETIFGKEWERAGVYARWLSFWLLFQCINKPVVAAIPALKLQHGLLIYEVFNTMAKAIALYIGYVFFQNDIAAVALFSTVGTLSYVWLIQWVVSKSNSVDKRIDK